MQFSIEVVVHDEEQSCEEWCSEVTGIGVRIREPSSLMIMCWLKSEVRRLDRLDSVVVQPVQRREVIFLKGFRWQCNPCPGKHRAGRCSREVE
jgi:hypothetical protein